MRFIFEKFTYVTFLSLYGRTRVTENTYSRILYAVFSSKSNDCSGWSVADGLTHRGLHYTESTEKFIRMCDQFFDCLNVCNTLEGQIKRKPALEPYRDRNDWSVKVFFMF